MPRKHSIESLLSGENIPNIGRITTIARLTDSSGTPGAQLRELGCYALVYVINGQGFYEDDNQRLDISAGDLILISPKHKHRYKPTSQEAWNEYFILFEGPLFEQWEMEGLFHEDRPLLKLEPIEFWLTQLQRIYAVDTTPLQQITRLQNFLADAFAHDGYQITANINQDWLAQAEQHLSQNLQHPKTVLQAATAIGLSYEAFRKKYTRLAGHPPKHFLIKSKMNKGARLLIETDQSIDRIAEQLNYCDQFHFSKRFKQYFGTTPSKYRTRIKAAATKE